MNPAVYPEPYKLPAGLLALVVHGGFFALLYFGFTWQALPPETMSAELWQSLPNDAAESTDVPPPVVEKVEQPAQREAVAKPDIVVPDKKKVEIKPVVPKPAEPKVDPKKSAVDSVAAQAARERAAQEAATGRVVDEYIGKIQGKIKRNIVMPPDVAKEARAEFSVTLLPGGSVMSARLTQSSGNTAYDNAVERAILKSQPLPLPADTSMFNRFRELKLGFRPTE
jgi:colicin import membrane protein